MRLLFLHILFIIFILAGLKIHANEIVKVDSLKDVANNGSNDNLRANALFKLADYYGNSDVKKTIVYLDMALDIGKAKNDFQIKSGAYTNLGLVYSRIGAYSLAFEAFNNKLDLFEKKKLSTAWIYIDIGNLFYALGADYKMNIDIYKNAISQFDVDKEADLLNSKIGKAVAYNGIGSVFKSNGNFDDALYYFRKACLIRKSIEDNTYLAHSCYLMADLFNVTKEYDSSLYYCDMGFAYLKENSKTTMDIDLLLVKAKANIRSGRKDAAFELYKNAIDIAIKINGQLSLVKIYSQMSEEYFSTNDLDVAFEYAEKGIAIAESNGLLSKKELLLSWLIKIYLVRGNFEKASIYQQKYISLADSLRKEKNSNNLLIFELGQNKKNLISLKKNISQLEFRNTVQFWFLLSGTFILMIVSIALLINRYYSRRRKRTELELRKLTIAVEQSANTIVITDIEGNIKYANLHFLELTGYSIDEVLGKNPRILSSGNQSVEFYKNLWDTIKAGNQWKGDFLNKKKNGELYWERASISPVFDDNRNIINFIAVKENITEAKKAEEGLRKAMQMAEKANRLKSEFLANMSHEIRTPMNAILGFSDILSEILADEEHRQFAEKILQSGNNLLKLIDEILDLSKIEAGQLKIEKSPINPHTVFNEVYSLFLVKFKEKKLEFNLEIENNLPGTIIADAARMRQVLINLVGNAIKFTDKGSVSIIVNTEKTNNNQIDINIEVTDTGIGIPEDQLNVVFDSFRQVEGQNTRKYGGTGLGLAITKRLVEMMNGKISVHSKVGKGSSFIVEFNNVEVSDEEIKIPVFHDYNEIKFSKSKLLIADDTPNNIELIKIYLNGRDIEIKEATSGKEVLEILSTFKPDLILMDITFPRMTGFEITQKIRENEELAHIPTIAHTARATKEEIEKYKNIFDDYLTKPLKKKELISTLSKYLKHKTITSNKI